MVTIKLYTSISGIQNLIDNKKCFAFTYKTTPENLEIVVDVKRIKEIDDAGIVIINETN